VFHYNGTSWIQRGDTIDDEHAGDASDMHVLVSSDGELNFHWYGKE